MHHGTAHLSQKLQLFSAFHTLGQNLQMLGHRRRLGDLRPRMVQQLAPLTSNLDEATDIALAFNNAMLAGGASTMGTVGGPAEAGNDTAETKTAKGQPDWAKRMQRSQRVTHGVQATAHAVRSGDSHASGSSVNLSERDRS